MNFDKALSCVYQGVFFVAVLRLRGEKLLVKCPLCKRKEPRLKTPYKLDQGCDPAGLVQVSKQPKRPKVLKGEC